MANPGNLKNFKKGYDKRRENNGRKPGLTQVLRQVVESDGYAIIEGNLMDGDKKTSEIVRVYAKMPKGEIIMNKLANMSASGNINAIKLLLERLEGMPKQPIEIETKTTIEDARKWLDEKLTERGSEKA